MKENEYLVKYALLPVKEEVYDKRRSFYKTICYIVSKVFVEEEHNKKNNDGDIYTTYKVCFPHTVLDGRINYFRNTPESPLARNNEMVVSKLFDDFEDAKKQFELVNINVDDNKLKNYELIESEILELTKDLIVSSEKNKHLVK